MKKLLGLLTLSLTFSIGNAGEYLPSKGQPVEDSFIVVFNNPSLSLSKRKEKLEELAVANKGQVSFVYDVINGGAVRMNQARAIAMSRRPDIAWVEQDSVVFATGDQSNPSSWGLDRVDERDLPLDNNYHWDYDGTGVDVYVIDTGIRITHNDFGGRATWDSNFTGDGINSDCHGHGTHVAGTVGGSTYGVAKGVSLYAVKVLNCGGSGTWAGVIGGIDRVTSECSSGSPCVANMSLGGGFSSMVNDAINNSVDAGVVYAVAAGNNNADACIFSPGSAPGAITVGATTSTDSRSSFSNYGTCLDVFAPGSSITSAWIGSNTATNTISGTSMAAPHVAGTAASILEENPGYDVDGVNDELSVRATSGLVSNPGAGSPNRLLYTRGGGTLPLTPENRTPVAMASYNCNGLNCDFDCSASYDSIGGSVVGWDWDFGDGNDYSGVIVNHPYGRRGHYDITCAVTDDEGAVDEVSKRLRIHERKDTAGNF